MAKVRCSHCQLEYAPSDVFRREGAGGEELYFCCTGCEGVYSLLHNLQLGSFYEKLNTPLTPPPSSSNEDSARFDTQGFYDKYVRAKSFKGKELSQVHLIISGIHCAACVWLNEKILNQTQGIYEVSINYTNNKASITWDSSVLPLSKIISLIRSIGYDAYAYDSRIQESADKQQMREYYIRVIVALFCTMNIMWVAIAQYSGYFLGIDSEAKDILNLASFALCTPALFYSGFVFYRASYYGLKSGFIGMDMLVAVGSSLTYAYSIYAALTRSGETYFESVSMIITFVLIGKFLEVRARKNAGDSLDSLQNLLPTSVEVWNGSAYEAVSLESVKVGDTILVRAGEKIAIDGILQSEYATFDTQAISGESLPLESKKGEAILSGYINLNHQITYTATRLFSQSMMSHIIELVSSSLAHRPQIQNLANTLSQYFSRVILSIALLCFALWLYVGGVGVEGALMIAISVIIIACPCALALATPIASVVGIGQAYKHNILFKQAKFLESLAKAKLAVFDKTGTLTMGKPEVRHFHRFGDFGASDIGVLLEFVKRSNHPVAQGVARYVEGLESEAKDCESRGREDLRQGFEAGGGFKARAESLESRAKNQGDGRFILSRGEYSKGYLSEESIKEGIAEFSERDSLGISARLENGAWLFGGSLDFLRAEGFEPPHITLGDSMVFAYGRKSGESCELLGIFELYDELKPHAKALLHSLRASGIACVLLSGDREGSVARISKELGLERAHHALSPLQKAQWIESYKARHPQDIVVMIGDGINDAPALSQSDIAISMGAGSDIAIMSSDVVILDDKLCTLQSAFDIARHTYTGIKQNIALSIGYNALSIPLACAGLVIPLFAALSMSLSSLLVVLNSLRLKSSQNFPHKKNE